MNTAQLCAVMHVRCNCSLGDDCTYCAPKRSFFVRICPKKNSCGSTRHRRLAHPRLDCDADPARTAVIMGHRDQNMLLTHYRDLMKPSDAARYWKIIPQSSTNNIVRLAGVDVSTGRL